ncbi:coiled-coil-helix-coiled-coil-helix domain-containing protein 5 [Parasteatoda tepidariorum]|uniref:coiled-coil-helix-coiled-coil-helix domain-containing protein 5 n=1 Tax=Parasteatoda tepidariorum TaxID=114398 RepID=UPI00077FDACD|nr:coiled-coil-helix-coiled-coil-helix domain-containing protein 5 [Parasteatoda tepidariorum]
MEGKAMKIVNSHCGSLMERYSKCVERHPSTWNTACSHQRQELARCSETHPVMIKVKRKCDSIYRAYERCQRSNPNDYSRCSSGFNAFLNCVDRVADDASSS